MVYHSIIINVQDNANNNALDIYQDDGNSHEIIFKLVDGDKFFNVSGYTPEIRWFNHDTQKTYVSTGVSIMNAYRGYLSYVVGNSLLRKCGRFTVTLNLSVKCPKLEGATVVSNLSFKFIVNVVKNFDHVTPDSEVAITKGFFDSLCGHLNNKLIHLSEEDREALNKISALINYIVVNKPDSDQDVVKVLSDREDFADLVNDIAKTDPALINRMLDDIAALQHSAEGIENQLGELVSTPSGQDVTNIHDYVDDYPKWNMF